MTEVDPAENPRDNSKRELNIDIESLRKLIGSLLDSYELDKLDNDLQKVFVVDKNKFPEMSSYHSSEAKFTMHVDIVAVLLRHIYQSKKFSMLKEKNVNEDYFKHLFKFVHDATKEKRFFSSIDLLAGIAKFLITELRSLDKSLENSTKKISEACEYNLKGKSSLSSLTYLTLHAVLSSTEIPDLIEKTEQEPFASGLVRVVKGVIMSSRFPQHNDCKDICILDVDCLHFFHDIAFNCLRAINGVLEWLCKIAESDYISMKKSLIKSTLKSCIDELAFVMLQHIGKHSWTSTETTVEAQNLLTFLCKLTCSTGIESLLSGTENVKATEKAPAGCNSMATFPNGIAQLVLENVCLKFVNGGWKRDTSLAHIITYITTNMKFPNLKAYIKVIVPLLLEVIGDYRSENQVLGIECLRYLIENVTASDLNLYNHGALIYQALFKLLYGTKPPTLRVLLPCLHRILYVLEPFPERLEPCRPSKWDEVLQKLVTNLEYENCSEAREILVSNLSSFMNSMGINCARYLLSILRTTSFCLEMYDGKDGRIRKQGLNVLKALVTTCWPVMWRYLGSVIKITLQVVIDTSMKGALVEEEAKIIIKEKSKEILILLSECCGPDSVLEFVDNALKAEMGDYFQGTKEFLMDAKRDIELDGS